MTSRRLFLIGTALAVFGCATRPKLGDGFDDALITDGIRREYAGRFGEVDDAALQAGREVVATLEGVHEERSGEQIAGAYPGMVLEIGSYPVVHYWRFAGRVVVWLDSASQCVVVVRSDAMRRGAPEAEADPFVQQVYAAIDRRLAPNAKDGN